MEQKKLSQLQKNILMLVYNNGSCSVFKYEIRQHYKRSGNFDTQPGIRNRWIKTITDAQRAATSRAIKRLTQRGLLQSDIECIELTDAGLSVVQTIQPDAQRRKRNIQPNELANAELVISKYRNAL